MLTALLLVLTASPPPASKALALEKAAQWDDLYLAFASAPPASYSKSERPKIAGALARGCAALLGEDAIMAYSLGERSVVFQPTAEGLYCTGVSGLKSDQRASAEESFRAGMAKYPKDFRFPLELGRLFAVEGDATGARDMFRRVPPKAPEFSDAQTEPVRLPKEPVPEGASPGPTPPPETVEPPRSRGGKPAPPPSTGSLGYQSSVDDEGRRVRANQYFRFRYFNAQRDFGQRAEYEGRVQGALDEARRASDRLLGVSRATPTDVILYSRAEFEMHHGPQAARSIAGFYSASAIRMNDSAEITPQNQATLVHEYVHAVVDELSGFHDENVPVWLNEGLAEFTEWRYEGHEVPQLGLAHAIRQLAISDRLPALSSMSRGPLIGMSNPALAYAVSALAVKVLVSKRGMSEVLGLIRDCGRGVEFVTALSQRYGQTAEEFDREVAAELKH